MLQVLLQKPRACLIVDNLPIHDDPSGFRAREIEVCHSDPSQRARLDCADDFRASECLDGAPPLQARLLVIDAVGHVGGKNEREIDGLRLAEGRTEIG